MLIVPINHHDDATLSISTPGGSPDVAGPDQADSPITNTQNGVRGEVWRNPDIDAISIRGTFDDGLARPANYVGFFRHRLLGASVRVRFFSAVNQGGTTLWDSGTLPAQWWPTITTGYDWGGALGLDPMKLEAPFRVYAPAVYQIKSYQIDLTNFTSTLSYWSSGDAWHISRIVVGCTLELVTGPAFGGQFGNDAIVDSERSVGGSDRTGQGAMWRTATVDLNAIRESEAKFWRDMAQVIGYDRDFVVSFYDDDGTVEERDHHWNVKFAALDALGRQAKVLTRRLQLKET